MFIKNEIKKENSDSQIDKQENECDNIDEIG